MKQYNRFRLLGLLSLFCLSAFLPCSLSAQPPSNWTADMPSSKIPTGVTLAEIDTLDDEIVRRFTISLDATTYDNAVQATAFNAIGAAAKSYLLNTWCGAQALDTADMSVVAVVLKNVNRGWDTFDHPDPLLQYYVAEDVYWITGLFKYKVNP